MNNYIIFTGLYLLATFTILLIVRLITRKKNIFKNLERTSTPPGEYSIKNSPLAKFNEDHTY